MKILLEQREVVVHRRVALHPRAARCDLPGSFNLVPTSRGVKPYGRNELWKEKGVLTMFAEAKTKLWCWGVGEGDGGGGRMKRRISEVLIADIQLLDLAWLLDPSCEVLGVKGKMEGVAITYHYVQTEAEV